MDTGKPARKRIQLPHSEIEFADQATGRPAVFAPGVSTDGMLRRNAAPRVAAVGHRRIIPDRPSGSDRLPMRLDADLGPPGIADHIGDFLGHATSPTTTPPVNP